MSVWLLPVAAAAFSAGLLAHERIGGELPVPAWLGLGAVTLAFAAAAGTPHVEDRVRGAGLIVDDVPASMAAVAPVRFSTFAVRRGVSAVAVSLLLLGVGWGEAFEHRISDGARPSSTGSKKRICGASSAVR